MYVYSLQHFISNQMAALKAQQTDDLLRLAMFEELIRDLHQNIRHGNVDPVINILASNKVCTHARFFAMFKFIITHTLAFFSFKQLPVDSKDRFGNTALMVACQSGSKKMIKVSLRFGANLNAQNFKGNTALHFCFAFNYIPLAGI
jgi:ankyrin repeat protein